MLTVDGAAEQRLAQVPVAPHHAVLALEIDGVADALRAAVHRTDVDGVLRAVDHDDPVVAHPDLVARHLAGDLDVAVVQAAVDHGGHGDQDRRVLRRQVGGVEAVRVFLGDEVGGQPAFDEALVGHQGGEERNVVADAADVILVQRLAHAGDGGVARRTPAAQLGDHGVVEHGDLAALIDAGVHADMRVLRRRAVVGQPAGGGQEVAEGVLRIDAGLDGPAVQVDIVLLQRQLLARRDADHQFHQIEAGDQLGDRMLHLEAGVHLQEVEVALRVHDELDRAGGLVVHGAGQGHGLLAHRLAGGGVEEGRRRLFDHLLVAALDRAFTLAQIQGRALPVRQHLDFDVARLLDVLLDEHAVVGEGGARLVLGRPEAFAGLLVVPGHAHALAAAAGGRLDHHRIADVAGDGDRLVVVGDDAQIAGHRVDARGLGQLLGLDLVAHGLDGVGVRADEGDPGGGESLLEFALLGQEAVAGMDGLGAGLLAGVDDAVDQQVALRRRCGTDVDGLVGHLDMQGVLVGIRIDGNRLDAQAARRADDAAGDLAAVRDQDLGEQGRHGTARLYSGMLSCLRQGFWSCLFFSMDSALMTRRRVPCGMMTSSM